MPFLDFIDQFDTVEKVFYDEVEAPSEKEGKKFKEIYEIVQMTPEQLLYLSDHHSDSWLMLIKLQETTLKKYLTFSKEELPINQKL